MICIGYFNDRNPTLELVVPVLLDNITFGDMLVIWPLRPIDISFVYGFITMHFKYQMTHFHLFITFP